MSATLVSLTSELKLSKRERRLLEYIQQHSPGGWVSSWELVVLQYGQDESSWPLHGRITTTGCVASIGRKMDRANYYQKLVRQGGGRGGVEYRLINR